MMTHHIIITLHYTSAALSQLSWGLDQQVEFHCSKAKVPFKCTVIITPVFCILSPHVILIFEHAEN